MDVKHTCMRTQVYDPDKRISLFVKSICVFESADENIHTTLPFFADGYPGLMFHDTVHGLTIQPHQKKMPLLFLYGQTIKPVTLEIDGAYQVILFQLYPFVLKNIFGISPPSIHDNCYDLQQLTNNTVEKLPATLLSMQQVETRIEELTDFLYQLFLSRKEDIDSDVRQMIEIILASKGKEKIIQIAQQLKVTVRTLERKFLQETGLTPKKFAMIIQFQSSLKQLSVKDFNTLADIVYENGFADQSHFIKVFKAYTGKTPKAFHKK